MLRTRLFIIMLFAFAISGQAFAQKNGDTAGGSGNQIKADTVSLTEDVSFDIDDFVRGAIVLPSGTQVYGLLRFNGKTVIFKDTLTQKTKRYGADELKGFTATVVDTLKDAYIKLVDGFEIAKHVDKREKKLPFLARSSASFFETDTFKICPDTLMVPPNAHTADFGKKYNIMFHFAKLMVYGNRLCLYKSVTTSYGGGSMMMGGGGMGGGMMMGGSSSSSNVFYFKRYNERGFTELPTRNRPFKKLMATYLKDDPKLVDDINKELLDVSKIDQIVDRYNQDKNAK